MQFYFIGGLGGNGYHLAPLIDELGFPVTFLDPYREMIQTEKDLCAWFQDQIGQDEEICLLGHSLGGDLARYLAAEFPQIRALILLDGGYLDMEKILPLEEELEGTSSFMQQQVFATVEEAVSAELGDEVVPSPMTRKAVEASYRWNPASERYELNLKRSLPYCACDVASRLTRLLLWTSLSSLSGLATKKSLNGEKKLCLT